MRILQNVQMTMIIGKNLLERNLVDIADLAGNAKEKGHVPVLLGMVKKAAPATMMMTILLAGTKLVPLGMLIHKMIVWIRGHHHETGDMK